jgi:hypothetical protein
MAPLIAFVHQYPARILARQEKSGSEAAFQESSSASALDILSQCDSTTRQDMKHSNRLPKGWHGR